jgi:hypothetical protein
MQKTRELDVALDRRPTFETTYQRTFCRSYHEPSLPLLNRPPPPLPPAPIDPDATPDPAETTYQDAFCRDYQQPVVSFGASNHPHFRAVSGTTTHNAPKLRALDRGLPGALPANRPVMVARAGQKSTIADHRWIPRADDDA